MWFKINTVIIMAAHSFRLLMEINLDRKALVNIGGGVWDGIKTFGISRHFSETTWITVLISSEYNV